MNILARLAIAPVIAFSFQSHAALLKLEKGTRSIEGVNISKSATTEIDKSTTELGTVGGGLRWKKVLLMKTKVYVAQLLVSSPERFTKKPSDALKSLDDSTIAAIQMTFLRTVEADKVQNSFRDALSINKVDLQNPAIKAFLSAVSNGGDASSGGNLTVLTQKHSDGTETVIYEDTNGKQTAVKGDRGLTQKIFSIWLGTPADDGVASLKNDLLGS
ncbi:chalcone isomerase family protein [Bdellovibrio reynosensis]|uniref:Chalcone isomerase family protein n=1 Tax=Bdellovibrio reynosensis TaxID=2835041 RepID=A0ABY4C6P4_9BACT|nr:chalcone isomerase family protein [Bdellovibrio reynosensis]UOF00164.1 chalcone isomerase family protein [Bdellovibrio reynosensis]